MPSFDFLRKLSEYNKIAKIDKIARRYFVMNGFDGVLAMLGILIASYIVGSKPNVVVITGLGAGISMAVSGIWGAYLTERAERQMELKELERATLTKLKGTKIGRAANIAVLIIALIDGAAPLIAAMMILVPFFILSKTMTETQVYSISISICLIILFLLGVFLGRLTKENVFKIGFIMMLAGVTSAAINYFLLGSNVVHV